MSRKIFLLLLATVLLVTAPPAEAQQPKKVPRIGYLSATNRAIDSPRSEEIRAALRELGYIDGQNIAIEFRYSEGKPDRAPDLAAELVRLKVDIIVVSAGDTWIREAMNATKTIPIVMGGAGSDPVEIGLVESLARPGGNVTGLTNLTTELGASGWNCSKKPYPDLPVSRLSSIPAILPVSSRSKRSSQSRRVGWG